MSDPFVVGPGKTKESTVKPVVPPVTPQNNNSLTSRIDQKLKDAGYPGLGVSESSGLSLVDSLSTSQLSLLAAMLKKRNYTVKASGQYIKNLFGTEPELMTIAASAGNDFNKLVSTLASDLLPGIGREGAENLPSRQIYQYRDEDLDVIVNDAYQAAIGRKAEPEELAIRRQSVRKQLEMGTLSVTKKVKNPKTGQLESVTTQTPAASKTEVQSDIESELAKMNPDEVDRKKRIDFSSWLSQNAAGA